MMADISVLEVRLYDEPIGTLTRVEGDRTIFAFNEEYVNDPQRPTLGLRFKDAYGELITEFKMRQTKVMPFFSNLLPEGHMRRYLADTANVNPEREFFLLWVLGQDLAGAITIVPADGEDLPPTAQRNLEGDESGERNEDSVLRFSLAGVQLKFSAIYEATGGLTIPAKGVGGSWIVKLPSREYRQVPENEFSMMTMARLVGIDIPAIQLIDVNSITNLPAGIDSLGGNAFAIERFDRLSDGSKVHIEDFAQVFNVYPHNKYKKASFRDIAEVVGIESSDEDISELIRRLTFNALIGNSDMHLKNWSMMYPDRRNAALAPAYDFVSTTPYIPDDNAALTVSRTKRFDGFSEDELSHLSARARLPEQMVIESAKETVELFRQHWNSEKHNLPLTQEVVTAVEHQLQIVPLAN
ncbi:type II toxin-antitoxin system HipA family toxin [Pseudomonadota bacterium]